MTQNITLQGGVTENAVILTDENIGHWFSIIEEDSLNLQSQVTDNYIENNTSIQDYIAISPAIITLRGYVGEIEFSPPVSFTNYLVTRKYDTCSSQDQLNNLMNDKLTPISELLPPVDNITQQAKNTAQYVESSFRRYEKIYNQLKTFSLKEQKQPTQTVQKYAAEKLKQLWESRALVEVITPYGKYENMAIQSITFTQGNSTTLSNLSITLKQINYATTETTQPDEKRMEFYNAVVRTEEANNGKAQGIDVDSNTIIGGWAVKYAGATPGGGVRRT